MVVVHPASLGIIHTLYDVSSINIILKYYEIPTTMESPFLGLIGDTYYKGIPLPRIPNNRAPGRDSPLPQTAWAESVTFAQRTFNCPQRPHDTVTTRLAPYILNP